jgi:3-hydroxybutyryl-CoA dehydrogenase
MEVTTVAIIGAGPLGCSVAYVVARARYRVILEDISISALEQGMAQIAGYLDNDISRGRAGDSDRESLLARITTVHSVEDVCRDADLIVETAPDEEEAKLELFTIFDRFAKPGSIFASTTTSFSITELAAITVCPERCIGMRFSFMPSQPLEIELVPGHETSNETVKACREVTDRLRTHAAFTNEDRTISTRGRG